MYDYAINSKWIGTEKLAKKLQHLTSPLEILTNTRGHVHAKVISDCHPVWSFLSFNIELSDPDGYQVACHGMAGLPDVGSIAISLNDIFQDAVGSHNIGFLYRDSEAVAGLILRVFIHRIPA